VTDEESYNPFADESPLVELNRIIDLLSLLAGVDFRKPDPAAAQVWLLVARAGKWTVGEAFRAAALHLRDSTEFCKPAHITALVRTERRARLDRYKALPAAVASPEVREAQMARIRAVIGEFAKLPPERPEMGAGTTARRRAERHTDALASLDDLLDRGRDAS
jgi:hypothetical protein